MTTIREELLSPEIPGAKPKATDLDSKLVSSTIPVPEAKAVPTPPPPPPGAKPEATTDLDSKLVSPTIPVPEAKAVPTPPPPPPPPPPPRPMPPAHPIPGQENLSSTFRSFFRNVGEAVNKAAKDGKEAFNDVVQRCPSCAAKGDNTIVTFGDKKNILCPVCKTNLVCPSAGKKISIHFNNLGDAIVDDSNEILNKNNDEVTVAIPVGLPEGATTFPYVHKGQNVTISFPSSMKAGDLIKANIPKAKRTSVRKPTYAEAPVYN